MVECKKVISLRRKAAASVSDRAQLFELIGKMGMEECAALLAVARSVHGMAGLQSQASLRDEDAAPCAGVTSIFSKASAADST